LTKKYTEIYKNVTPLMAVIEQCSETLSDSSKAPNNFVTY